MQNNKSVLFMCVQTGDISIKISNSAAADWSGEFYLKDITTDRNTIGNPLAAYFPVFTSVLKQGKVQQAVREAVTHSLDKQQEDQ